MCEWWGIVNGKECRVIVVYMYMYMSIVHDIMYAVIGVSLSEPHTDEYSGYIFSLYAVMYMYIHVHVVMFISVCPPPGVLGSSFEFCQNLTCGKCYSYLQAPGIPYTWSTLYLSITFV